MIETLLLILYVIACLVLILFVLLQPGKSDAAAVFGGGVNSAAFGPRGTATVLAKVTIGAAILFFMIAFLFSIPNLFGERSIVGGEAEPAPPPVNQTIPVPPADANQNGAFAVPPATGNANSAPAGNANSGGQR